MTVFLILVKNNIIVIYAFTIDQKMTEVGLCKDLKKTKM